MRSGINAKVSYDFFMKRREDRIRLSGILKGIKVHDIDIDRLYAKKLKTFDIKDLLREFK